MTEAHAKRLGDLVRARRRELKLTQADVQESGGPSTATIRLIEGGKHTDLRPGTVAPLEQILKWQEGSIAKVLEGGDPIPAPEVQKFPADMTHALRVEELWHLLTELADSPDGDPLRTEKADDALVSFADFLIEMLLTLNAGSAAKSLIQEMTGRAFQILHLDKETNDAVETTQTADAQTKGHKGKEVLVPKEVQDGGSIDADVGSKADDSGVGGTQDGEQREDLTGG